MDTLPSSDSSVAKQWNKKNVINIPFPPDVSIHFQNGIIDFFLLQAGS